MATQHGYPTTTGVLLAGGSATRLGGGDKGLMQIGGKSLLRRVIECLGPQCNDLVLNANGDAERFSSFGLAVIADTLPGQPGPLGGILAALDHVALHSNTEWLLSAPADCPFLPCDLASHLHHACRSEQTKVAVAQSARNIHAIIALWHVSLRADLYHALVGEGMRKARSFVSRHRYAVVDWPNQPVDPFFNVNTSDDLNKAAQIVAAAAI